MQYTSQIRRIAKRTGRTTAASCVRAVLDAADMVFRSNVIGSRMVANREDREFMVALYWAAVRLQNYEREWQVLKFAAGREINLMRRLRKAIAPKNNRTHRTYPTNRERRK